MADDQAKKPGHDSGTRKGEELQNSKGQEPGREDAESTGAGRPAGTRTSRDSTSINPKKPIDPDSPEMPPA